MKKKLFRERYYEKPIIVEETIISGKDIKVKSMDITKHLSNEDKKIFLETKKKSKKGDK